jgi:hypothetical protein
MLQDGRSQVRITIILMDFFQLPRVPGTFLRIKGGKPGHWTGSLAANCKQFFFLEILGASTSRKPTVFHGLFQG